MADTSTTDPADQDPISQTVTTSNALNFKNMVDTQIQLNQTLLANTIHNQNELHKYSMQALSRSENINNASTAIITAAAAKSVKGLLDPTNDALADAVTGGQAVKADAITPPVYTDPVNYSNLAQMIATAVTQAIAASIGSSVKSPA